MSERDTYIPDCDCRSDQVLCFWQGCPRAARIRIETHRNLARAHVFLGDQSKGVTLGEKQK